MLSFCISVFISIRYLFHKNYLSSSCCSPLKRKAPDEVQTRCDISLERRKNMTTVIRSFASEDDAGVLPEVMAALNREALKTPRTSCFTYDDASHGFERLLKETFTLALDDPSPSVYFVFNAAAANMLSILFCTQPHDVVICSNVSRLILDESFSAVMGSDVKLLTVPINENGKISMDTLEKNLDEIITMHQNQVKMLTISQPSEYGTVYTVSELKQLSNTAKKYGLYFRKLATYSIPRFV